MMILLKIDILLLSDSQDVVSPGLILHYVG